MTAALVYGYARDESSPRGHHPRPAADFRGCRELIEPARSACVELAECEEQAAAHA